MKASIFIFFLFAVFCANAQVKSDSNKVASTAPAKVSVKADTVGCWFKELKRSRYAYGWFRTVKDSSLKEVWQHGYVIKGQSVVYLYADKKTPVKNRVVESFEHKPAAAADVK